MSDAADTTVPAAAQDLSEAPLISGTEVGEGTPAAFSAPLWVPEQKPALRGLQPRRAMRGTVTSPAASTQMSAAALWNNSNQGHYLIVRTLSAIVGAAGQSVGLSSSTGKQGTPAGDREPLTYGDAMLPGALFESASSRNNNYTVVLGTQGNGTRIDYEGILTVLPPNAALIIQASALDTALTVTLIWEAIPSGDPDFQLLLPLVQ